MIRVLEWVIYMRMSHNVIFWKIHALQSEVRAASWLTGWMGWSLREKLIKIGAKVVSHGRYVTFEMAEVAVSRLMFRDILMLIAQLRAPPARA